MNLAAAMSFSTPNKNSSIWILVSGWSRMKPLKPSLSNIAVVRFEKLLKTLHNS